MAVAPFPDTRMTQLALAGLLKPVFGDPRKKEERERDCGGGPGQSECGECVRGHCQGNPTLLPVYLPSAKFNSCRPDFGSIITLGEPTGTSLTVPLIGSSCHGLGYGGLVGDRNFPPSIRSSSSSAVLVAKRFRVRAAMQRRFNREVLVRLCHSSCLIRRKSGPGRPFRRHWLPC